MEPDPPCGVFPAQGSAGRIGFPTATLPGLIGATSPFPLTCCGSCFAQGDACIDKAGMRNEGRN